MAVDRFTVADADKVLWGKLVKSWIRHEKEWPRNLEELKAQCLEHGMQAPHVPDYMTGLVFVQNDRHVLTIRLPPKELVEAGEEAFRNDPDGGYPLPSFYTEFFRQPPPSSQEKLDLQAARIGEYSVNSCQ